MRLNIEKLVYGGEGLARVPADGGRSKAVFVPFTLPGEQVEAESVEDKPGFARARLVSVAKPSPQRVAAPCPHFQSCGGCDYQHASYAEQLKLKEQILRETLLRTAKIEWNDAIKVHSGEPFGYRNRVRFHVARGDATEFGFHRARSSEVLSVRECPILMPLLQKTLVALWHNVDT